MSVSPSGDRPRRRMPPALFVALTVVAIAVATAAIVVGVDRTAHQRKLSGGHGFQMSAAEARGRDVFKERCQNCHSLSEASAIGNVGPNLDTLAPNGIPALYVKQTVQYGLARGAGNMPPDIVVGDELDDVARFVCRATTVHNRNPRAARASSFCDPDSLAPEAHASNAAQASDPGTANPHAGGR